MRFSLLKNDRSTKKDELVLALIILVFMAAGIVLCCFRPHFWIIEGNDSLVFGVALILIGVMFIPGLVYRLFTNEK
ncbi:MAG: hypothetical protein LIP10_04405 [Clostridiales bacterium]|nr:hypothetical protein [Clostridiales bacterium]